MGLGQEVYNRERGTDPNLYKTVESRETWGKKARLLEKEVNTTGTEIYVTIAKSSRVGCKIRESTSVAPVGAGEFFKGFVFQTDVVARHDCIVTRPRQGRGPPHKEKRSQGSQDRPFLAAEKRRVAPNRKQGLRARSRDAEDPSDDVGRAEVADVWVPARAP